MLVIVALMFPVMFGLIALAVDASSAFVQKRSIQNAADAAALAAAQDVVQALDPACMSDPSPTTATTARSRFG